VLPRAFVAPEARIIAQAEDTRAALADHSFDPAKTVILTEAPASPPPAAGEERAAVITEYGAERVLMTAEGPGYLVLTDAYYPGWVARVDGEPTPILRADLMFRAVALGPGTHAVEFVYAPSSVRVGMAVSGAAWLGLVAALVWVARGRRS
jgi:hypothetical protein